MREVRALFYVESNGEITLTNERATRVLSELGLGTAKTVEEVFGVPFDNLRHGARDGVRVPTFLGFVGVDALAGREGRLGVLVTAGEEALRGGRLAPSQQLTMEVVRGTDPSVASAIDIAERYARTSLPVLIVAERGAGGLRLARRLHELGAHRATKLIEMDGRNLDAALQASRADIETMDGCDVLVRSIDEAPRPDQTLLVKLIDDMPHIRLIAWSHTDPRGRIEPPLFTPELGRMLRSTMVSLPPLRDRIDRVELAERMLSALAPECSLSAAARKVIDQHTFPGNFTELEIILQRARAQANGRRVLEPDDLPTELVHIDVAAQLTRRSAERFALEEALRTSRGNLSVAAKRLGVARTTFYRMLERHGLERKASERTPLTPRRGE